MDDARHIRINKIVLITVRSIALLTFAAAMLLGIFSEKQSGESSNYYMNAFTCALLFAFSYIPYVISSKTSLTLPVVLQTGFVIFMFCAQLLGEVLEFYEIFSWWDLFLHSTSAFMLGIVGFLLFDAMDRDERTSFELNRAGVMLFSFCFVMTCGALWEIFEFAGDMILGMNMQKSVYVSNAAELAPYINKWGRLVDPGIVDTMTDLIVDGIGGAASLLMMHFSLKKRVRPPSEKPAEGLEILMKEPAGTDKR